MNSSFSAITILSLKCAEFIVSLAADALDRDRPFAMMGARKNATHRPETMEEPATKMADSQEKIGIGQLCALRCAARKVALLNAGQIWPAHVTKMQREAAAT
jgi:hypothetical protein